MITYILPVGNVFSESFNALVLKDFLLLEKS